MNETICNVMLFGGIALAVVFAVIAVILFVKLDIPKVIGDLSGSTARKQIKEIREKGYESLQGSGASKKDAIKSKGSTSKIEVRDIKGKSASEEVSRKGNERYKKAVDELNKSRSHHHTRPDQPWTNTPAVRKVPLRKAPASAYNLRLPRQLQTAEWQSVSGLPATGTVGFSFCCRRDVCRKTRSQVAMIFPVPDIYRQGRSIFLQQFGS